MQEIRLALVSRSAMHEQILTCRPYICSLADVFFFIQTFRVTDKGQWRDVRTRRFSDNAVVTTTEKLSYNWNGVGVQRYRFVCVMSVEKTENITTVSSSSLLWSVVMIRSARDQQRLAHAQAAYAWTIRTLTLNSRLRCL